MYNNYYSQQTFPNRATPAPAQATYAPTAAGLKGRPVSSLEEVRATGIDFDGSIFYFPDLANKKIYTKQINMDGTASLNVYELSELPTEVPTKFVTREEFENTINQLRMTLVPPMGPESSKVEASADPVEFKF